MRIDRDMLGLISELEYIIGRECYNPNSYDGWNDIEGCKFRYPVHAVDKNGERWKVKGKVHRLETSDEASIRIVRSMKYKFGSNELYIGNAIEKILDFLEERYDLDFEELEDEYLLLDEDVDF